MVIFLHGDYPWDIIEGHSAYTEVLIVGNLANFTNKAIQVRGRNAVDSSEEVGGCKTVMVSRRATPLSKLLALFACGDIRS